MAKRSLLNRNREYLNDDEGRGASSSSEMQTQKFDGDDTGFKQQKKPFSQRRLLVTCPIVVVCVVVVLIMMLLSGIVGYYVSNGRTQNCDTQTASDSSAKNGTSVIPKEQFTLEDVLLPKNVKPYHYAIESLVNFAPEWSIQGYTEIFVECFEVSNKIVLHAQNMNFSSVELIGLDSSGKETSQITVDFNASSHNLYPHFMNITLKSGQLTVGRRYKLKFTYTARIYGYHMSEYFSNVGEAWGGLYAFWDHMTEQYGVATKFEPVHARKTFPCFDQPHLKATFEIGLGYRKDLNLAGRVAYANNYQIDDNNGQPVKCNYRNSAAYDNWTCFKFAKSPIMSTYLVAFMIFPESASLVDTELPNSQWKFEVIGRALANNTFHISARDGAKILRHFEELFGINYTMPELKMTGLPAFKSGAMENWGLVTYRETRIWFDPEKGSVDELLGVIAVIAHELAHQWFGNLVTMTWWSDLWLNEGWATLYEMMGTKFIFKDTLDLELRFIANDMRIALGDRCSQSSSSLFNPNVVTKNQQEAFFNSVSYSKGGVTLRMFLRFMKDKNFYTGTLHYLQSYRDKTASHREFVKSYDEACGQCGIPGVTNVSEWMLPWIVQGGFPVIIASRKNNTHIKLTVVPSALHQQNLESSDKTKWGKWLVPFEYRRKGEGRDQTTLIWLSSSQPGYIRVPEENWFVANQGGFGYYVVVYDNQTVEQLTNELLLNHETFGADEKMMMMESVFYSVMYSFHNVQVLLNLTRFIENETDANVWDIYSNTVIDVLNNYVSRDSFLAQGYKRMVAGRAYRRFTQSRSPENFSKLTWNERRLYARLTSLACRAGEGTCVSFARKTFADILENVYETIKKPEVVDVIYYVLGTGIRYGTQEEWEKIYNMSIKTSYEQLQLHMEHSLSWTTQATLLQRLFTEIMDDKIRPLHQMSILTVCGWNLGTGQKLLLYQYILSRKTSLLEKYPDLIDRLSTTCPPYQQPTGDNLEYRLWNEIVRGVKDSQLYTIPEKPTDAYYQVYLTRQSDVIEWLVKAI